MILYYDIFIKILFEYFRLEINLLKFPSRKFFLLTCWQVGRLADRSVSKIL